MKAVTLVNFVPRLEGETSVPLGPLYIAAVLEKVGCCVDFRDYQTASYINPLNLESMIDFFAECEDTIGISCLFNVIPFLLPALKKIKAEHPEKTIILGGPGPSSTAEKLVERFPFIDVVVKGEGELTAVDLAKGLPYKDVKGIVYNTGTIVTTPEQERIRNLDELPFPAYEKVDFSQYDHTGVITARGCPYHCTFCEVAPLWGYHTEQRSVTNVVAEIKMLYKKYGVTTLHINDDTFVLNRKWVEDFCHTLKVEGIDITWRSLGRINLMDRNLLAKMADAGCIGIQYGIESGSEAVLKRVDKQITILKMREVIKLSCEYIGQVVTTFMWGFPFETMDDFYQTVYVMGEVADMGALVKLLFLSPAPLSPLYRKYCNQLRFDKKFVSNLLWGVFKDTLLPEEKGEIIKLILENPDVFPGFYYVYSPDVEKKYRILKEAGLLQEVGD